MKSPKGRHFRQEERKSIFSPRVSKFCWAADMLTYLRILIAFVLFYLALTDSQNVGFALGCFVFGELTDAFDGALARTLLYPNDGKKRWWRMYASEIDQAADIMLGLATLVYFTAEISFQFGRLLLMGTVIIAVIVQASRGWIGRKFGQQARTYLVLARRYAYVGEIFLVGLIMLHHTNWFMELRLDWRITITYLLIVLAVALLFLKRDRATEEKTETPIV